MTTQGARNQAIRELIAQARRLTVIVGKQVNPEFAQLDLTIASLAVLRSLADGPATVPDLARRLLMSRQATQRFVDDLTAAGRIERVDNPRHARSPLYAITPTGDRAIEEAARIEAAFLDGLALDAPVAELREAAASLDRLRGAVLQRGGVSSDT